jgi:SNF2-related domain/Helicase conserved C-terminal domain
MDEQCICLREEDIYHSPLKDLHWLRIIIDEGHEFSSATSNAVLVAEKMVTAERRWVVSGTPARDRLYGVEADLAVTVDYALPGLYMDDAESLTSSEVSTPMEAISTSSSQAFKYAALERRKVFNPQEDVGNASATKSLGLLAQHFLKIRPWYQDQDDEKTFWDDHIYRHEHFRNKTYTSFSGCLRRILQNLVIKTQPEDVERDITLPPLSHTVVRLEPSFYDKLTANLFILVLTANAITSERTDVDYLFHKNSAKERYRLIGNLRQSNFVWTGFSIEDVESAIKTSWEYLKKENTKCSAEDRDLLVSCIKLAEIVLRSPEWATLSRSHEIGLFINNWPDDSSEVWALHKASDSLLIGATQLLQTQNLVNNQLFSENPIEGLQAAGEAASIAMAIKAEEESTERKKNGYIYSSKRGIPTSAVNSGLFGQKRQSTAPQKSDKSSAATPKAIKTTIESTVKIPNSDSTAQPVETAHQSIKMSRKRKREMNARELEVDSALRKPSIIGTVSAKLTYLLDRISELQKEEKIIVFYDGDNTAFYLSQCLDILHIKHLIYTKALSSDQRSRYIVTFDTDDSIRVLLMDIRCGAFGLNVNKASRVFFINPVCRPSTEAQAIKRAHRIGQLKPVMVETLVLNNTIEANIFERSKKMTQVEHFEASQLSDDKGIARIIKTALAVPVTLEEGVGEKQMAKLSTPMQIFGRPGRGDTKIRGIDRDWDTLESPTTVKKAKIKSGKGKLSKVEKKDNQRLDDAPVLSGVDWMNQPSTFSPLGVVTQGLDERLQIRSSLGHNGETLPGAAMGLEKDADGLAKSIFG